MTSPQNLHERLSVTRAPRSTPALILALSVACSGGGDAPTTDQGISTWTTEVAYQLAEVAEAGVFFETPVVRTDPERNRVVVVDAGSAQVSVWTPEGVLRAVEGRVGEGLGSSPSRCSGWTSATASSPPSSRTVERPSRASASATTTRSDSNPAPPSSCGPAEAPVRWS